MKIRTFRLATLMGTVIRKVIPMTPTTTIAMTTEEIHTVFVHSNDDDGSNVGSCKGDEVENCVDDSEDNSDQDVP